MTGGLLTFYGDDFTGSADVLLQYRNFGLTGVILLAPPDATRLAELAERHDVIGFAGIARSLPTERIEEAIDPIFRLLSGLRPRVVQYKVCSTADSAPEIGSFGPALALGRRYFGAHPVPVLIAQPGLGRYTVFSHHFALDRGVVYRLDRQPTMANHPVTPLSDSDLRAHLGAQTPLALAALDVRDLESQDSGLEAYRRLCAQAPGAIVFDTLNEGHLRSAARLMMAGSQGRTLFALGSGGLSAGIAAHLTGGSGDEARDKPAPVDRVLVVSGSCSELTAAQTRRAVAAGWAGIPLDPVAPADSVVARVVDDAIAALGNGPGAVVHTALGTQSGPLIHAEVVGRALARVVRECRRRTGVSRVVIAGGDSSGHVVRGLGAAELEAVGDVGGMALLCRVVSASSDVDGLEIVLKGGQIGDEDFFETVRRP